MQKKLLLGITGLALLFGFVLAACDTNLTGGVNVKDDLNSIPGPALHEPIVADGLIVLSWNSVTNASGYRIVRKDLTTNETTVLTDKMVSSGGQSLSYADCVSWTNQLVDDRDYEYTVISLNESGINRAAGDTVILSGESKKRVKAKVPASITVAAPVFQVRSYIDASGADKLLVTIDSKPNLSYRVAYAYGADQIVQDLSILNTNATGGGLFGQKAKAEFPLIGGKNTVTVQAGFVGGADYYPATAKGSQAEENEFTSLPAVSNFNVNRTGEAVEFTWADIVGADPASWAIYKVKTSALSSDFTTQNVKVLSDWTAVATIAPPEKGTSGWTAYERAPALDGFYTYALIATIGTQKSRPATSALGGVGPYTPSQSVLAAAVTSDGKVQLTWQAALQGASYELSYAEVISATPGSSPSVSNYVPQEAFKAVIGTALAVPDTYYPQGRAVVLHEPASAKSYAYKLVVTKGGVKSSESVQVVAQAPYTQFVSFSVANSSSSMNSSTEPVMLNADEIRLRVTNTWGAGGTNQDASAYSFQVYYRLADNPQSTYQAFGSAVNYAAADFYKDVTVTGLTIGRQYQFKVVVADRENSNNGETSGSAAGYNASLPNGTASYYTTAQTSDPQFPDRSLQLPSTTSNGLAGLRVKVEYPTASGTSTADLTVKALNYGGPSYYQHAYYIQLPNDVITGWTSGTSYPVTVLEYLDPIQNSYNPPTYNNVYGN